MDQAIIGFVGIVAGLLLGGIGKYFTARRDAWLLARAHGLILLADVQATLASQSRGENTDLSPLLASWQANCEILASFRRGSYPSGFKAPEWLMLAAGFARLAALDEVKRGKRDERWQAAVSDELRKAERLLDHFASDPGVLGYVVGHALGRKPKSPSGGNDR